MFFDFGWLCVGTIGIIAVLLTLSGLCIIQEYERGIVFRLGKVTRNLSGGLNWIIPGIEQVRKVDIRTMTVPIERQETITRDSVTVKIDAVLWYRIVSPARAILSVADYRNAVHQMALTTLRNIVGQHLLDEVLKERDGINHKLQKLVDDGTEPWGIKVEAVEMKDVEIPVSLQRAMAREAEATREKRARIIKAEAELEASDKLTLGAQRIAEHPMALELRRMQMISEVGAEQNTTTIIMLPSDFVTLAKDISQRLSPPKSQPAK